MSTPGPRVPVALVKPGEATRDLNAVVHRLLVVGLVLSTLLFLTGLALDVYYGRSIPDTTVSVPEAIRRALALRPSGFLDLGLMALIATPIMRVAGSILVFVYERDWRYAAVTTVVLVIMMTSILLGQG
ncbi:MAG: DUF1634 domain-containing protein [Ardenticatenaceae bacterium]|nr:DUF1634 domain-containing protein [Ardenticatenaceae bacterium]HBY92408.1 DUF1634 domain-containing protein [Chloroflexota bacterium]